MAEVFTDGQMEMCTMEIGDSKIRMDSVPLFLVTDSHKKVFGLTVSYRENFESLKGMKCD